MPGGRSFNTVCDAAVTWAKRGGDVDVLLEEDLDDAVAAERLQLDVLDVRTCAVNVTFVVVDDAAGHVVRQQPVVGPDDADDRNVDVREDVGRRLAAPRNAEKRDENRQHDERVGPPQRG